jgi:hypothetical protein
MKNKEIIMQLTDQLTEVKTLLGRANKAPDTETALDLAVGAYLQAAGYITLFEEQQKAAKELITEIFTETGQTDAVTPPSVAVYLTTAYQYHWFCCTCGAVRHRAPGIYPGECECGSSSWKTKQAQPSDAPWYVQILDPECPTCQRTANELHALIAQMELFA